MRLTESRVVLLFVAHVFTLAARAATGEAADDVYAKYKETIAVAARPLKTVFETGELVPIVVAVANLGEKPVYMFASESDFREGSCILTDNNGKMVMGEPVPTPRESTPEHYYVERDGKRTLVHPLYKIEPHEIKLMQLLDAVKRYRKYISEGTFTMDLGAIRIIHEADDLIEREDVPHRLWLQPSSRVAECEYIIDPIKIEIRKKEEKKRDLGEEATDMFDNAWPSFIGGTVIGLVVSWGVLLVRRKRNRG